MSVVSKNKILYVGYIVLCLGIVYLMFRPKEKTPTPDVPEQVIYKEAEYASVQKKNYISDDSLVGYWMLVGLGYDRYNNIKNDEQNYDLLYHLKYMPVEFLADGEKIESYSQDMKTNKLKWYFKTNDTLVEYNSEYYRKFEVLNFKNETLKLKYFVVDSNSIITDVFYFTLCKIHPEKYSSQSLFSKELSLWREKTSQKESQLQLKLKLKSLLSYNSVYLRSIYYSSYQALNTKHLHLPFDYYSNSMLFKTKLNSDNFNVLFNDTSDACKAYQLLKDASSTIKYPKTPIKDDYILEYANYMDALAKRLEL